MFKAMMIDGEGGFIGTCLRYLVSFLAHYFFFSYFTKKKKKKKAVLIYASSSLPSFKIECSHLSYFSLFANPHK